MSNGPTGLGVEFRPEKKLNISFSKKDYCAYKFECKEHLNIKTLCWNCIWMEKFDVPEIIKGVIKNGSKL